MSITTTIVMHRLCTKMYHESLEPSSIAKWLKDVWTRMGSFFFLKSASTSSKLVRPASGVKKHKVTRPCFGRAWREIEAVTRRKDAIQWVSNRSRKRAEAEPERREITL